MIFGLIPVGGKGIRLGLPYSKEMLPQKNYDYYNPMINHLVEKMEFAGAELIFFVHGKEYKKDIQNYYNDSKKYIHVKQETLTFSGVLYEFYYNLIIKYPDYTDNDKVLFGLPDTVFDKNPFVEMVCEDGIVAGLFVTEPTSKVDRLNNTSYKFEVKTEKTLTNSDKFWGVLKFDIRDIHQIINEFDFQKTSEIGEILNFYDVTYVHGEQFLDVGTWENYNLYHSDEITFSNTEIEKKFDATDIDIFTDNLNFLKNNNYLEIESTDYYYTNNNKNIEFIRYRERSNSNINESKPDITIKNFKNSQSNRFELVLPVAFGKEKTTDVHHFLSLLGCKYEFCISKSCYIIENYKNTDCDVVYYEFKLDEKIIKFIEIESKHSYKIKKAEKILKEEIKNFDSSKIINKSKFQIAKEYYDAHRRK